VKIGIIRTREIEYNPADVEDLRRAVEDRGHDPVDLFLDSFTVRISSGRTTIKLWSSRNDYVEIDVGGALLRHLGTTRNVEQLFFRVWSSRALELSGVYVMNPVLNWLISSDKLASLLLLAKSGLPVPPTVASEDPVLAYRELSEFKEVVVKPLRGAMGFGIFKAEDLDLAFRYFSLLSGMSLPIYAQKYLEKEGGGDYRVVVVDGEVIGVEYRRGGWKSNVAQGAKPLRAEPRGEVVELALKAVEVLGLDYAGVDLAETKDGFYVLEVNPTLSWQGFKRAVGVNPANYIVDALLRRLKR